MRVETLCTGDELLTGLIADTNSIFFQELLLQRLGLQVRRSTVVGDEADELFEAMQTLAARADVVLVSGGLGPTADDLTAEIAARAAGVPLEENQPALTHLVERLSKRGMVLTDNNKKQALVPQGAQVVVNPVGSAPMFSIKLGRCTLFFVPGVPREYRYLVEHEVLPRIEALAGAPTEHRVLGILKTVNLPESHLDAKVAPLAAKYPNVVFGFRTHAPENHLKLMARAKDRAEAEALLARVMDESAALLDGYVFGRGQETLAGVTGALLRSLKQTVAVAESCTGGSVSSLLTSEPGSSDFFMGGAVTYRENVKTHWAHVAPELLSAHGVVSEPVARALAEGIRTELGTDWGIGVTGWAGPSGGDATNPVGTVFLSVVGPGVTVCERRNFAFGQDRARVVKFAAWSAVDLLRREVRKTLPPGGALSQSRHEWN